MANPLEKYLENDLADFAGLRVSGTLPVKQEVLNDLLQSVLTDLATPKSAAVTDTPKPASSAPNVDPSKLVKFVKKAQVRAEDGRLVLDFDLAVDGPETAG